MTVQTQPDSAQQVRAMIDLLAEQRDLYQQLKTLSDQQACCIRDGSTEALLTVLSQRQGLIEALTRSNTQVAPYRQRWSDLGGSVDADQREQVRQVLAQIEQMLQEIMAQDDRDRAELKSVQQQLGTQLNQVGQASRAIRAYGSRTSGPRPATFTDRQG